MKERKSKLLLLVLIVAASMLLSGCVLRMRADDLYRLPELSQDYLRLQGHINTIHNEGAEFSPPISGPNRQSVQLKDLNGDGINEVIAFFRIPSDSTLKIIVFEMVDGDYSVAEVINGAGTAIESIRYADMDGDGVMEIIVGWQLGDALKHMEIYSIIDFNAVRIQSAEYEYITVFDINSDSNSDIIIVRLPTIENAAVAQVFFMTADREINTSQVNLSAGIETISRIVTGSLINGFPAVFIESEGSFYNGSFVTDICTFRNGEFTNILLRESSGVSDSTIRQRRIHSADINGDGIVKVPIPRRLISQTETTYYVMDWFSFNNNGAARLALTTYHNPTDEWFLVLPLDWRDRVSVRREDAVAGERTVVFSYISDEDGAFYDFMSIHRLTGDMREARSRLPGRVWLASEGASIYVFELLETPDSIDLTIDEQIIRENFQLIFFDWLSGTL